MEQASSVREGFSPPAGYVSTPAFEIASYLAITIPGLTICGRGVGVGQVPLLNLTLRALADAAIVGVRPRKANINHRLKGGLIPTYN